MRFNAKDLNHWPPCSATARSRRLPTAPRVIQAKGFEDQVATRTHFDKTQPPFENQSGCGEEFDQPIRSHVGLQSTLRHVAHSIRLRGGKRHTRRRGPAFGRRSAESKPRESTFRLTRSGSTRSNSNGVVQHERHVLAERAVQESALESGSPYCWNTDYRPGMPWRVSQDHGCRRACYAKGNWAQAAAALHAGKKHPPNYACKQRRGGFDEPCYRPSETQQWTHLQPQHFIAVAILRISRRGSRVVGFVR